MPKIKNSYSFSKGKISLLIPSTPLHTPKFPQNNQPSSQNKKSKFQLTPNLTNKHRSLTKTKYQEKENPDSLTSKQRRAWRKSAEILSYRKLSSHLSQLKQFDKSCRASPSSFTNFHNNSSSVFISKVVGESKSKNFSKLSKKLNGNEINFRKVNFSHLYALKNKLQAEEYGGYNAKHDEVHDFSAHYIISNGNLCLHEDKDLQSEFSDLNSENSLISDQDLNNPSEEIISEQLTSKLLNLNKKRNKEFEFQSFLMEKKQCFLEARTQFTSRLFFQSIFGPIRIQNDPNQHKMVIKVNQMTSKKILFHNNILKKMKKKIILKFVNIEEIIYYQFQIKRRDKLDKRKAIICKQKMLLACENYSEQDFKRYLGKYLKQNIFVKSTFIGKKIYSNQQFDKGNQRTSLYNKNEIEEPLTSSFSHLNNQSTQNKTTLRKMEDQFTIFVFLKIKKKYFLFKIQKERELSTVLFTVLYEINQLGSLPFQYQTRCEIEKNLFTDKMYQVKFFRQKFLHKPVHFQTKLINSAGKNIFGLNQEDFIKHEEVKQNQFCLLSDKNKNKITIIEQVQLFKPIFTYKIQELFQKKQTQLYTKKNAKRNSRFSKELIQQFVSSKTSWEEEQKRISNASNSARRQEKSRKKIVKKQRNFFKLRNSFDYGILRKIKSVFKIYENFFYRINFLNFTVLGRISDKFISFPIEKQEQKERILILNLPYHLDPKLSEKMERFTIENFIKQKKKYNYTFSLNNSQIYQCIIKSTETNTEIVFKIVNPKNKKIHFYSKKESRTKIQKQNKKQKILKLAHTINRFNSMTYLKFIQGQAPYQIMYKNVQKICCGVYLIFTIVNIPSIRFSFLRIYDRKNQITYTFELKQFKKSRIREIISYYEEFFMENFYSEYATNEKIKLQKKNRQLIQKMVVFKNNNEMKKMLFETPTRKSRRNNFKLKIKRKFAYQDNESDQKRCDYIEVGEQILRKFYTDKFNRKFLISLIKYPVEMKSQFVRGSEMQSEKYLIKVLVHLENKILKLQFVLKYDKFLDKILPFENILSNQTFQNQTNNTFFLSKPFCDAIDADLYCRTSIVFRNIKNIFNDPFEVQFRRINKRKKCDRAEKKFAFYNAHIFSINQQDSEGKKQQQIFYENIKQRKLIKMEQKIKGSYFLKLLTIKKIQKSKLLSRVIKNLENAH